MTIMGCHSYRAASVVVRARRKEFESRKALPRSLEARDSLTLVEVEYLVKMCVICE